MPVPEEDELARIDEVCDAVVELIDDNWNPSDPDEVSAPDELEIDTKSLSGRHVYVFATAYGGNPATRGQDSNDYEVTVIVAEKYGDSGRPTQAWRRYLTRWCEWLLGIIANDRGARLLADEGDPDSGLWVEEAETSVVFDVEELTTKKLFLSVMKIRYREHADG